MHTPPRQTVGFRLVYLRPEHDPSWGWLVYGRAFGPTFWLVLAASAAAIVAFLRLAIKQDVLQAAHFVLATIFMKEMDSWCQRFFTVKSMLLHKCSKF